MPQGAGIEKAAKDYLLNPAPDTLERLARSVDSPWQELLRRLNLAPNGTSDLVHMRQDLITRLNDNPGLEVIDRDFAHLFSSWFNRGFLVLVRMSWSSPASILEKIIAYEAVHEIMGWDDLKRKLDPRDRRCFAFFHPALVDEPLIFVEVALGSDIPASIQTLLEEEAANGRRIAQAGRSIPWRASTLGMEQGSNGSIGWATPPKKVCARP